MCEPGSTKRGAGHSDSLPNTSVTWTALGANPRFQNLHNKVRLTDSLMRRPLPVIHVAGFGVNTL